MLGPWIEGYVYHLIALLYNNSYFTLACRVSSPGSLNPRASQKHRCLLPHIKEITWLNMLRCDANVSSLSLISLNIDHSYTNLIHLIHQSNLLKRLPAPQELRRKRIVNRSHSACVSWSKIRYNIICNNNKKVQVRIASDGGAGDLFVDDSLSALLSSVRGCWRFSGFCFFDVDWRNMSIDFQCWKNVTQDLLFGLTNQLTKNAIPKKPLNTTNTACGKVPTVSA